MNAGLLFNPSSRSTARPASLMKIVRNHEYMLSNPKHGTHRARCLLASSNGKSLTFSLAAPIAIRGRGGMCITDLAPILLMGKDYTHLLDGSIWKIEPIAG